MIVKTKILIGILVIGIVLIFGWLVWNSQIEPKPISGTPSLPKILIEQVTIITDKTEYEQGETVKITVKNNLTNPIKHLKGVGCGLHGFSSGEWRNASSKSCRWDGEDKLKPNSEYNFDWITSRFGMEKYKIAFYYQEQELIETKEKTIGKIICEGENLPNELKKLLINGEWIMSNKGCGVMCEACFVCSCTVEDAWTVGKATIDVHLVSCSENSYTIKYKGGEYNCVSENYRNPLQRLPIPIPSEEWETIYSNEFKIKEKSALDPLCSKKVVGIGDCDAYHQGYEFDSETGRCVKKGASGCSFEIPFESLEECQEVCENEIICRDENYECTIENIPCCSGLKEATLTYEDKNGQCVPSVPCGSICLPCGNGICEGPPVNENKCNCPEDCK